MNIERGAPIECDLSGVHNRINKLNKIFPIKFKNGIDYGAGKGAYTLELKKSVPYLVASDIEKIHLLDYKIKGGGDQDKSLVVSSITNSPFKSDSFECLFTIEVLEHVESLEKSIKEIIRIVKPGAIIYITVPNKFFPLETHMVRIFGMRIKGYYIPMLSCIDFIHNKIGTARRFSIRSLKKLFSKKEFEFIGHDYMMPPFDNFGFGRKFINPVTIRMEKTFLKFLSPTLIAVFKKK